MIDFSSYPSSVLFFRFGPWTRAFPWVVCPFSYGNFHFLPEHAFFSRRLFRPCLVFDPRIVSIRPLSLSLAFRFELFSVSPSSNISEFRTLILMDQNISVVLNSGAR
jgi:hypothetical protein